MIRVLLGFALPILGLGGAAALLGPSLSGSPAGEPMLVAAAEEASFQPASFEAACAETLLLTEAAPGELAAGLRVVALAFLSGADGVKVRMEDVADGAVVLNETLLLVLDSAGRLVAAGSAASFAREGSIGAVAADCGRGSDASKAGSV